MNEHLMTAQKGDLNVKITLRPASATEFSGKVKPGRYRLVVKTVDLVPNKENTGKNVYVSATITGPAEANGMPFSVWIPAPMGANESVGNNLLTGLCASIKSHESEEAAIAFRARAELDLPLSLFVGKTFYTQMGDSPDGKYSQVGRYVHKGEYEANPGADRIAETELPVVQPAAAFSTGGPNGASSGAAKPAAAAAAAAAARGPADDLL